MSSVKRERKQESTDDLDVSGASREAAAVWAATTDLHPWDKNPRDNKKAIKKVADSIKRFGFGAPILARPNGEIIAGHTRWAAAQTIKLDRVPVRYLDLDPAEAHLLALADNKLGEIAEWDDALVASILSEYGLEDAGLAGFDSKEIDKLANSILREEDRQEEASAPETVDEALAESDVPKRVGGLGEAWECDEHLVLCADSTKPIDIDGDRCVMLFTDPPYGMAYRSRGTEVEHAAIENDDIDPAALEAFLAAAFRSGRAALAPGASAYVFHYDQRVSIRPAFEAALICAGFSILGTIVWVKQAPSMGWQDYRGQHEPILYAAIDGPRKKVEDRTQTTVWDERRDAPSTYMHPTQKPISLACRAMRNSTAAGDRVLDLFGGSGSTLLAAEVMKRRAVSVELEPRYCDVAIERWVRHTGKEPRRVR